MKLFHFPYRWLPRTLWANITHPYYDIKNGIHNIFTFFEAIWWFHSWDWTGMIYLLEVSAHEMRLSQSLGIHVGAEREAKRLLIVETLCKRLREDEYFTQAGHCQETWDSLPNHERTHIAKHSEYMAKQDTLYLGKMIKFVQHWWC